MDPELAVDDLERIRDYIAKDSEFYSLRLIERVFQVIERLKLFPESGRVVPEINDSNIKRTDFGPNYRIIYKIDQDFILYSFSISYMVLETSVI